MLGRLKEQLPAILPDFLKGQRWFGGKSRGIAGISVLDVIPIHCEALPAYVVLTRISYRDGVAEMYSLPFANPAAGFAASADPPSLSVEVSGEEIRLYDALFLEQFQNFLLQTVMDNLGFGGGRGHLRSSATVALSSLAGPDEDKLTPSLMRAEQSNTSISYGGRLIFKWFRRPEAGVNPDVEIGAFLTEKTGFRNVPQVAGFVDYVEHDGAATTLGLLQAYIVNQGDAWRFTLEALRQYYANTEDLPAPEYPKAPPLALARNDIPADARETVGTYFDSAALLGQRTAELHCALASGTDPAFTPESFDRRSLREIADSATTMIERTFPVLREKVGTFPAAMQEKVERLLAAERYLKKSFQDIEELTTSALRSRIHGDYHLGQVLYTGSDFVIIDFEGEPARSLEERRRKRSPLQDVAGMLRSFDYAAWTPLIGEGSGNTERSDAKLARVGRWAEYWRSWVSAAFLRSYLGTAKSSAFIPTESGALDRLLEAYIVDKALYEINYELNNRPAWLAIPLNGILSRLEAR